MMKTKMMTSTKSRRRGTAQLSLLSSLVRHVALLLWISCGLSVHPDRRGGVSAAAAFASPGSGGGSSSSSFGGSIHTWRDVVWESFPGSGEDRRLGREQIAPPRPICILPFPYTDVLLQGETKQLRLYENRFIKLFEECQTNHGGVLAMGLLTDSGIIQTVPLCEIEAYNRIDSFGIFVTIRAVSRAKLLQITQQEPYMKGACIELCDVLPPNLELPNLVASNIDTLMVTLSSMEHRLEQAHRNKKDDNNDNDSAPEDDNEDAEMKRRIALAKLEDRFYADDDDDDDDDEADNDDDDDTKELDRRARFRKAYQVALVTDVQGYAMPSGADTTIDRTPQELAAISWAAFCTELLSDMDATFRIQALDSEHLFDRLRIALRLLRHKRDQLKKKLDKAGLSYRNDDLEDGSGMGNSSIDA